MNRPAPAKAVLQAAPRPHAAWAALHRAACAPYRGAGRFAWFFARGKLGRDPVFRSLLERGDIEPGAQVVDIGCGQGLLASLLAACDRAARQGRWPAGWPAAPAATRYTGIELMPKDVARAQAALAGLHTEPQIMCGDMCSLPLPACDTVVILDVLHYVDHAAQEGVLRRVRAALRPGGRLLLRVGDMSARRRFVISQWVDHIVTLVRGHSAPPTFCRPLAQWVALLQRLGFDVQPLPMSRGTPFANVLLVASTAPAQAAACHPEPRALDLMADSETR
jgi:SAM-dependent methyltransferase